MYDYFSDLFKRVSLDDTLLRLLYYKPKQNPDPLSPSLPNIVGSPVFDEVREINILRAPKSTDLTDKSISRVCMYMGQNVPSTSNYSEAVYNQDVVFDVFVNINDFEMIDCRSLKICDRLNELLYKERVTGLGKLRAPKLYPIGNAPNGYIGYKLVFTFGSTKT